MLGYLLMHLPEVVVGSTVVVLVFEVDTEYRKIKN